VCPQRRDHDGAYRHGGQHTNERSSGVAIVGFRHQRVLRDGIHEQRSFQLEERAARHGEIPRGGDDLALRLEHPEHGRPGRMALSRRDIAECPEHLGDVGGFRKAACDCRERRPLHVVGTGLDDERVVRAVNAADDAERRMLHRRSEPGNEAARAAIR
jgi:hypothetical protein